MKRIKWLDRLSATEPYIPHIYPTKDKVSYLVQLPLLYFDQLYL